MAIAMYNKTPILVGDPDERGNEVEVLAATSYRDPKNLEPKERVVKEKTR